MKKSKIKVVCNTKDSLPLSELSNFQKEMKTLSEENEEKLKTQIIKKGICTPFFVWKDKDINYIIDGHQREKVLSKMVKDGFLIPDNLPVVYIEADNKKDAGEKLLAINSTFGKIDSEGLLDFLNMIDYTVNDLKDYDLPFDLEGLEDKPLEAYYDDIKSDRHDFVKKSTGNCPVIFDQIMITFPSEKMSVIKECIFNVFGEGSEGLKLFMEWLYEKNSIIGK